MNIKNVVEAKEQELIDLRRYFHRYAEQSWQEFNTQKKIIEVLEEEGIPYETPYRTAVVATVKGPSSSDHILGIRADIDALPITELTSCSFRSENDGTMHACGHDAHTAILLQTARLVKQHADELKVTVRFIFQPAEEFIEDSGAYHLKDIPSILECDRIIGLHVSNLAPAGAASLVEGPIMASADTFDIEIKGKGGHAAHPEQSIDPIQAAVEFISSLNRVVARELSPLTPNVISITSFNAGTTFNVIPERAHLMGTARSSDPAVRDQYENILNRVGQGVALATGTSFDIDFHWGCPVTINDHEVVVTGKRAMDKVFEKENIVALPFSTGGEDFSKYKNPKAFLNLGVGFPEEERRFPLHNPYFDLDESGLKYGVEYFLQYIQEWSDELGN